MKKATHLFLVLVTAPNIRTARKLARDLLQHRLVACVNLIPKIESHYRWQGKMEVGTEILMLIKTNQRQLAAVEERVVKLHPYDTPEVLSISLSSGTRPYLDWLVQSLT